MPVPSHEYVSSFVLCEVPPDLREQMEERGDLGPVRHFPHRQLAGDLGFAVQ